MSTNNFSSNISKTPWWTQHQNLTLLMENPSPLPESPNSNPQSFNCNPNWSNFNGIQQSEIPKQPMFEKPLTPSDVGKLNRLVIPKQYAEKYFPLGAASSDSGEKGLLLSFEDESGKPWRFRYSYWSSSQSYVLTKGWSRFVKEKRLEAGDVVLFERNPADCERLFIGWRRRAAVPPVAQPDNSCIGGGGGWGRVLYNAQPYPAHPYGHPVTYQAEYTPAGGSVVPSQRNPNGSSINKRHVRLFGVNLECEPDESESEPIVSDGSSFSSDGPSHYNYYTSTNLHNQMDMNLAGDVNQMRYQYYPG